MESERVMKATSGRPGDEWQGDQSHPGVGGALSARAPARAAAAAPRRLQAPQAPRRPQPPRCAHSRSTGALRLAREAREVVGGAEAAIVAGGRVERGRDDQRRPLRPADLVPLLHHAADAGAPGSVIRGALMCSRRPSLSAAARARGRARGARARRGGGASRPTGWAGMAAPTSRPPSLRRARGLSTPRYIPSYSRERERHRCRHAQPCLAEAAAGVVAPPLHSPPRASSPPPTPSRRCRRQLGGHGEGDSGDRGGAGGCGGGHVPVATRIAAGSGARVEGGSERGGDSGADVVARR